MRIARPPATERVENSRKSTTRLMKAFRTPELSDYLSRMNAEYYHWDEMRRRPLPVDLTPEEAWTAIKWSRSAAHRLKLTDSSNAPFTFWLPDAALQTLHHVDRSGGGLMAFNLEDSDLVEAMRERILIDSHMEEAIATSQIEGAVTTRQRAKEMLRSGRPPKDNSERMIVNGFLTIKMLRERANDPLTPQLLHDIQSSMTRGTLKDPRHSGRFRSPADEPVHVWDTRDNEVVFTPPDAALVETRIARMLEFANEPIDSVPFMHPLVRAVILHFWLAYEHPYCDGNGRTARALFYWYMLKSGYWLFEFLTISRIINSSRMNYYRSFIYSETDENDLTYFLMHQLGVTKKALNELHTRLREMTEQQERVSMLRRTRGLNTRQRALIDHALRHPTKEYTFESHQRSHGITYQTARTDILGLVERRWLEQLPSKKPMKFVAAADLSKLVRSPTSPEQESVP